MKNVIFVYNTQDGGVTTSIIQVEKVNEALDQFHKSYTDSLREQNPNIDEKTLTLDNFLMGDNPVIELIIINELNSHVTFQRVEADDFLAMIYDAYDNS